MMKSPAAKIRKLLDREKELSASPPHDELAVDVDSGEDLTASLPSTAPARVLFPPSSTSDCGRKRPRRGRTGPKNSARSPPIARPNPDGPDVPLAPSGPDRGVGDASCDKTASPIPPSVSDARSAQDVAAAVLRVERELTVQLPTRAFVGGKVTHVYNPLQYATAVHAAYVRRFAGLGARFLLVGMNPGPWGMSQNGVPFGEVGAVRDWFQLDGEVLKPADEHPQRPVAGFDCTRNEVSGLRFWSLFRRLCGSPERFFRHAYVYSFCPLAFMERTGRNVTPNCLSRPLRERLESSCAAAVVQVAKILQVETVIGIGKYAEEQTRRALRSAGMETVPVFPMLHPSPINPQANKDWSGVATRQLEEAGLLQLLTSQSDEQSRHLSDEQRCPQSDEQ